MRAAAETVIVDLRVFGAATLHKGLIHSSNLDRDPAASDHDGRRGRAEAISGRAAGRSD
jgi:hypothetical protein